MVDTPRDVDEALALCRDDAEQEAARADVVARLDGLFQVLDSAAQLEDAELQAEASQAPKLSPGTGVEGWAYREIFLPAKEFLDMQYQARNPVMADLLADDWPEAERACQAARELYGKLANGAA